MMMKIFRRHNAAMSLLRPGFRRPFDHAFPDLHEFFDDNIEDFFEDTMDSMARDIRRMRLLQERRLPTGPSPPRKRLKTVEIPISNTAISTSQARKEKEDDSKGSITKNKKSVTDAKHSSASDTKHSPPRSSQQNSSKSVGDKNASVEVTNITKPASTGTDELRIFPKQSADDWFTIPLDSSSSSSLLQKSERADRYIYKLDNVDGNVKCSVKGNTIQIEGKTEEKYDNGYSMQSFMQSFSLPSNVEADKAKAAIVDGTLCINIPKLKEPEPVEQETTS